MSYSLNRCIDAWISRKENGINDVLFPNLDLMDRLDKTSEVVTNSVDAQIIEKVLK